MPRRCRDRGAGSPLAELGALGGTPFHAGTIDTGGLAPGLHLPVGELKELRRADVVRRAAAHEQFGVTRGTMRTLTVLRGSAHRSVAADLGVDRATSESCSGTHNRSVADSNPAGPI